MEAESSEARKGRIRSLYVVHVSMLVFSLGFSINLTGVFPYMKQLLPTTSPDVILNRYGWVIAMNPLGQMIASPLLGYIFNKTNNLRALSILMAIFYVLGNSLYALLTLIPSEEGRFVGLLASRFISGFAFGVAAPMRAYISSATFLSEKTKHLSLTSLYQTMGFIIGPGIQACLTPLQCGNAPPFSGPYFTLDMYTVAGWLSALMGSLLMVLFLPLFFHPHDVTHLEKSSFAQENQLSRREMVLEKPDYLAAVVCLFDFFVFQATFVLLETLATPLCMDQFAWSEEKTVLYLGMIMSIGGILSLACFFTIPPLSKRIDERYLYHVLGIVLMNVGRFFMFSFGSELPPKPITLPSASDSFTDPLSGTSGQYNFTNQLLASNGSMSIPFVTNEDCSLGHSIVPGCSYDWCEHVPALKLWQVILSYAICSISFPYCITLCAVIFSKIIGPRPQGLWMGALASSGSLARVSGPILVSYAYKLFGINVTSGLITSLTLTAFVITLIAHNRMVPLFDKNTKHSEETEPCQPSESC